MSESLSIGESQRTAEHTQRYYELREEQRDARLLDLEVQKRLFASSQELLLQFYTLMRNMLVHSKENEAVQQNLQRLHKAIAQIFDYEYEIHIEYTGTDFLINERWSKLARKYQDVCAKLGDALSAREIGGIWISAIPQPEQLLSFVERLISIDPTHTTNPFSLLQTQLWRRNFDWISLEKYVAAIDGHKELLSPIDTVRQTYFQAIQMVQQLHFQVEQERPLKLKSAKHVIQALIDIFGGRRYSEHADLLFMYTQLKNILEYRYSHSVNVAVHVIGFAHYLGLNRSLQRDLGIAALLYDSGMIKLPSALLDNPQLSPQDRQLLEQHPIFAIPIILRTPFIDSTILRTVNITFGHHLGAIEGGYPLFGQGLSSLFAQIIAIVDLYDAMCTPQVHRQKLYTSPEALAKLAVIPERFLHQPLVRQFINWLGPLPIGTLLRLHEGSLGYVYRASANPMLRDRPIIKVLQSNNCPAGSFIDLTQISPQGLPYWQIAEIIRPNETIPQQLLLFDLLPKKIVGEN